MPKKYYDAKKGSMDSGYGGMISENRSAVANMPQEVVMKAYPKSAYMNKNGLDDSMRGIDETRRDSERRVNSYSSDSKW